MLKSYGWVGWWWVAHVILVSALGPNPSFFLFWGTFFQLGGLLGQGPGLGLGPGLDNKLFADESSQFGRIQELCHTEEGTFKLQHSVCYPVSQNRQEVKRCASVLELMLVCKMQ